MSLNNRGDPGWFTAALHPQEVRLGHMEQWWAVALDLHAGVGHQTGGFGCLLQQNNCGPEVRLFFLLLVLKMFLDSAECLFDRH